MKSILFLTGTRADFGKIKPLIREVDRMDGFSASVLVTGMHTLSRYGYTVDEVYRALEDHRLDSGFRRITTYMNQFYGEPMEMVLANTIHGLSRYLHEAQHDMIVVHGDRVEALAGAIVGAMRMVRVAHIEGGEISGTVDELIRHAASKLSHVHFVANENASRRLRQLGERPDSIYVIGSPDIDVMLSDDLPSLSEVKNYYSIRFNEYAVVILHPVSTSMKETKQTALAMVDSLIASNFNYVVIYPNNDEGCNYILDEYERLKENDFFVCFPSLRFEYFLTLLRNARFIIGNSSAGVREAPVYGVPSINIASRQQNRFNYESISNVDADSSRILKAVGNNIGRMVRYAPSFHFGKGESAKNFGQALGSPDLWSLPVQKQMIDL